MPRTAFRALSPLVVCLCAASAHAAAPPTEVDLVPAGKQPDFSYGTWEQPVKAAGSGAVTLQGVSGQGGYGYNVQSDLSGRDDASPALRLTVQPGNRASAVCILVRDTDGTVYKYMMDLPGEPGEHTVSPVAGASLSAPGSVDAAGGVAGLNLKAIDQVQVLGDWQAPPLDIVLSGLLLQEDGAALMEKRRAREAKEAAERQAREEAALQALAGLKRSDASPTVEHVSLVADDLLSLTIRAGHAPRHGQVAYVPQEGDRITPHGDHRALAWKDGALSVQDETLQLERLVGGAPTPVAYITADQEHVWMFDTIEGDPLTELLADRPAGYRITSSDDPRYASAVEPLAVYRKSKPTYQADPARDPVSMIHRVFLRLPQPLTEGATYTVELPGLDTRETSVTYTQKPREIRTDALHATQIGHRPDDPYKVAYLSMWLGTGGGISYDAERFEVLDASGTTVFTGGVTETKALGENETLKDEKDYARTAVYALDFSDFQEPGEYRVYLPGVGTSGPFRIGDDAWEQAFRTSMLGFLQHRSGIALGPPLVDYERPRPFHPADGVEVFELDVDRRAESAGVDEALTRLTGAGTKPREQWPATSLDAWGGYMDAGDWDRRSGHLLASYLHLELLELFPDYFENLKLRLPEQESGNRLPDLMDEALWNIGFYERTQDPDGGIRGGVESTSHPRGGEASWQESLGVGLFKADAESSFRYAAVAAKLARLMKPYDAAGAEAYRESAVGAWRWADQHRDGYVTAASEPDTAREELGAVEQLAAVELLWLTGEAAYADRFAEVSALGSGDSAASESAAFAYARLPKGLGDETIRQAARGFVLGLADTAIGFADGNSFGLVNALPGMPVIGFVGYLSTPGILSQAVPRAYALTAEAKYLRAAVQSTNVAAGANPDNLIYTTGMGWNSPQEPLHLDSRVTGQAPPVGITVYGPSDASEPFSFNDWMHQWFLSRQMTPDSRSWPFYESYVDAGRWPSMNEYTIHQTLAPTSYTWGFLAAREAARR